MESLFPLDLIDLWDKGDCSFKVYRCSFWETTHLLKILLLEFCLSFCYLNGEGVIQGPAYNFSFLPMSKPPVGGSITQLSSTSYNIFLWWVQKSYYRSCSLLLSSYHLFSFSLSNPAFSSFHDSLIKILLGNETLQVCPCLSLLSDVLVKCSDVVTFYERSVWFRGLW